MSEEKVEILKEEEIVIPNLDKKIEVLDLYLINKLLLKIPNNEDKEKEREIHEDFLEIEKPIETKKIEEIDQKKEKKELIHVIGCDFCKKNNIKGKLRCCHICFNIDLCEDCYSTIHVNKKHPTSHRFKTVTEKHKIHVHYNNGCKMFLRKDYDSSLKEFKTALSLCQNRDYKNSLKIIIFILRFSFSNNNYHEILKYVVLSEDLIKKYEIREEIDVTYKVFKEYLFLCVFNLLVIIGKYSKDDKTALTALRKAYNIAKENNEDLVEDVLQGLRNKNDFFDQIIFAFKKNVITENRLLEIWDLCADEGNIEYVEKMFNDIMLK